MAKLKYVSGNDVKSINMRDIKHMRRLRVALYMPFKYICDRLSSFLASIVLLVPLLVLCVWIMIEDFGNPFFFHCRVGKDGREFTMLKLRSMKKGADDLENTLSGSDLEKYLIEYKLEDDPRLIGWEKSGDSRKCFGAFLRRTSLDELPQIFWNILIKGNMSVVGPRPILREEMDKNYTPEEQAQLLSVKPGLTGYWQAYARNNATYEKGDRQRMELFYVRNCSLWLDLKILFATVGAVIREDGAR